jgi:excinuclease ABC subunit C
MTDNHLDLAEKSSTVTQSPGVYLMKDNTGKIIYVGKARNLKKRLSSYFSRSKHTDLKTAVLLQHTVVFETIVTGTEKEALILEANLIKKHRPKYNVVLKDDKRYPVLKLDTRFPFPNLTIARKMQPDGALYFGPFSSAYAVRQTLNFIYKTFQIRKCRSKHVKKRTRPCLHCQMQGCLAPCCEDVDKVDYDEILKEVILFLKGRTPELVREIRVEMEKAANNQEYEKAAKLRDKMFALEKTLEKQVSVTTDFMDRDVVGIYRGVETSFVTLLMVRRGFLLGTRNFEIPGNLSGPEEIISAFIKHFYDSAPFIPSEILIPVDIDDFSFLESWLKNKKGKKVKIIQPRRGEKAKLIKMANRNAENALKEHLRNISSGMQVLKRLEKRLHLKTLPRRIECFDNSHLGSSAPVSCMVVFIDGKAKKSDYRTYKLKFSEAPNDYDFMKEVIFRRYGKNSSNDPLPDLLMVDGGKGQLNVAFSILKELALENQIETIAIAKKESEIGEEFDKIYTVGRSNPISFKSDSDLLLFLQRVRDEAHRFVLKFHRRIRGKQMILSELDGIPGIGKKRKKALIKHFGSIGNIKKATLEELLGVPLMNRKIAETLFETLKRT